MPNYAARVRAARAYAHITQEQLAQALGVNVQTIKRRELDPGDELAQPPKKGERLAIAHICGVPPEFMEDGFGGYAHDELVDAVSELDEQLQVLRRELLVRGLEALPQTAEGDQRDDRSQPPQPG